ncbi:hypothetical protein R1flu_000054 [Riccia fluitans]|uniref:RING-type domain-containing protein n=1 Tax=Riccia fluitans TaxID=41844 RepID=A0ABD1Y3I4_9MARC
MTGAFCPICYEVVDVSLHNLESVTGCGHVFHEACLQKWVAHSPVTPKCPLCKASCGPRERQRLYFQTSADCSQPLESLNCAGYSEGSIGEMEEKVKVLKKSLELARQQVSESQEALEVNKDKVRGLSEMYKVANQQFHQTAEKLWKTEQELEGSRKEKSRLMKEMAKLERDIAATKLMENVDLSEDEVLHLTSGGGSRPQSKDDYIQILAKALVTRNWAFKTLMTTCAEHCLEKDAFQRESTKLRFKIELLQARLKDFTKAQERTENSSLRSLNEVESSADDRSERPQNLAKTYVNRTTKSEDRQFSRLRGIDRYELSSERPSKSVNRPGICIGREDMRADAAANHSSVLLPRAATCTDATLHTRLGSPGITPGSQHARPTSPETGEETNAPIDLDFLPIPIRRERKSSLVEDGFFSKDSKVSWKETAQNLVGSTNISRFNLSGPNGPCSRALIKPPPPFIVPTHRGSNASRQGKKIKLSVPQDSKIEDFFGRH